MECSRNELEDIVIGTLLNDSEEDMFFDGSRMSLRKELFKDKKNAFLFGLIEKMHDEGIVQTTPLGLFEYVTKNNIQCGDMGNFCSYMCKLTTDHYEFKSFKDYVRQLVDVYLKEKRNGTR